jgi:uncharacterized protein (DUF305 family)
MLMASAPLRRLRRLAPLLALALAAPALAPLAAQGASPDAPAVVPAPAGRTGPHPADVRFMTHMIDHHAQALVMSAMVPRQSTRGDLRLLAERIAVSQGDEIAQMRDWLLARGQPAPTPVTTYAGPAGHGGMAHGGAHHGMDHGAGAAPMPGMLTGMQLDSLAAARGPAFDRLFLRYMIAHHEGALTMVAELFAAPGAGEEPQLFGFASDVDADQRAEIARMRALLARLERPVPRR